MNKNLKGFFEGIKDIEDKNAGGCLFFAHVFWRYLKKNNLPTNSFEIVQYSPSYKDAIEHNIKWINKDNDVKHPISSFHFTWLYEYTEYDGEGEVGDRFFHLKRKVLYGLNGMSNLVEEFCVQALNKSSWNSMFERNDAIEIIKYNLDIDMSDVQLDFYC